MWHLEEIAWKIRHSHLSDHNEFPLTGGWHKWIAEQNPHENYVEMDEGKEDAQVAMHPCWVQQEISALYPPRGTSEGPTSEYIRIEPPNREAFVQG